MKILLTFALICAALGFLFYFSVPSQRAAIGRFALKVTPVILIAGLAVASFIFLSLNHIKVF